MTKRTYTIRKYTDKDKSGVLDLLKYNTPEYFDPSEERELIAYLDNEIEDYFVVEEDRKIIGSGGINYFPEEKTARISWDIIAPKYQGKGVGKQLTLHRLDYIRKSDSVESIVVRTSQLVYKFYKNVGFKLEKVEKDYWAKGFDLYLMKMEV